MASDYRQRRTIQIKLDVTDGHEHAEVNQAIHSYYKDLAKYDNWMQAFRDMVQLHGTLEQDDVSYLKKKYPGIYLGLVNSALLEAQEKVIDKIVTLPSNAPVVTSSFAITDEDRENARNLRQMGKMRDILSRGE